MRYDQYYMVSKMGSGHFFFFSMLLLLNRSLLLLNCPVIAIPKPSSKLKAKLGMALLSVIVRLLRRTYLNQVHSSQASQAKPKPRLDDTKIRNKKKITQTFNQLLDRLGKQNLAYKLN